MKTIPLFLGLAPAMIAMAFGETVTVDLAASAGPMNYQASGFLHGMTATDPPDSMINPLKPRFFRCANAWWSLCFQMYPRAAALGATLQLVLSDSKGYQAPFPGDGGSGSSTWISVVSNTVNEAKANGQHYQWDLWNEPDCNFIPGYAQYFNAWKEAYGTVRGIDPSAVIVGPSLCNFDIGWLGQFLTDAKAAGTLPDVLSWHEFSDGPALASDVAAVRQFMASKGINISRFSINEYDGENEPSLPGTLVSYFAAIHRAGVETAAHSCWPDGGGTAYDCSNFSLDGVVNPFDNKNPRAAWWVYKGYADITGTLVQVTPDATTDAVAGMDPGQRSARIVLGRNDQSLTGAPATIQLVIKNITVSAPHLTGSGKVHVSLQQIPNTSWATMASPPPATGADYAITNDQLIVPLPNFGPLDAFTTVLSAPAGTTPPITMAPAAPRLVQIQ